MASLNDPLLVFWRSLGDWGLIIVIVAVALEVGVAAIGSILEKWWKDKFQKWEPRLKRYEVMAGWILVIGLAMEYWGHRGETTILDSNNAALYANAKQAEKEAGDAFKLEAIANARASEFDAARAKFENEAELTRSNNLVLQAKLNPRYITKEKRQEFINFLKSMQKGPVKIAVRHPDRETRDYADQIVSLLIEAGYTVTDTMNYQANVTKFPANASVGFFVESETNQPAYSLPLYNAFTSIGIIPQGIINGVMTTEQGRVKPNELMILVLEKP